MHARSRGVRGAAVTAAALLLLLPNAWACEFVVGDGSRVYDEDQSADGAALLGDANETDSSTSFTLVDAAPDSPHADDAATGPDSSGAEAAATPDSSADSGTECGAACSSAQTACDESCMSVATTCIAQCRNDGNCPKLCTDAQTRCEMTCSMSCTACVPTGCSRPMVCTSVSP